MSGLVEWWDGLVRGLGPNFEVAAHAVQILIAIMLAIGLFAVVREYWGRITHVVGIAFAWLFCLCFSLLVAFWAVLLLSWSMGKVWGPEHWHTPSSAIAIGAIYLWCLVRVIRSVRTPNDAYLD